MAVRRCRERKFFFGKRMNQQLEEDSSVYCSRTIRCHSGFGVLSPLLEGAVLQQAAGEALRFRPTRRTLPCAKPGIEEGNCTSGVHEHR